MFKANPEIIITIVLGASLFTILSVVVGLLIFRHKSHQQQHIILIQQMQLEFEKQLMQSQIEVQEATFSALAKELHDNIGQLLSSTKLLMGITERKLTIPAPDTLLSAHETLGKAILELRSLSRSLNREWLEQFDLVENLSREVEFLKTAGQTMEVVLTSEGKIALPSQQQIILFRIIQEGLQNAIKHSQATLLHITLCLQPGQLLVSIRDNGIGLPEATKKEGTGLLNMRQRAAVLNGTIQWLSPENEGTTVHITIPVQHNICN